MPPTSSGAVFRDALVALPRVFIRAPAGAALQCLAALNAITHELVMVTNDTLH